MKCVRKEQYECIYLSKKIMTGIVLLNISVGIEHITSIIGGMF